MSKSVRVIRQASRCHVHCQRHASHSATSATSSAVAAKSGRPGSAGFWISVAIIPTGLVAASYATSEDGKPLLTRWIKSWQLNQEDVKRQNAVNTAAYEQAAADRHLFTTAPRSEQGFELRYQEMFNSSSPWNVAAGQGGVDLTKVMELYAKKNEREEQRRLERNGDGKIETVYDDTTGGRFPHWVPYIGSSKKPRPGYPD